MNNKYEDLIVIIPAYEPPVEFVEYAQSVSKIAKKLVIVNDGSNESYDKIFEEIIKNNEVVYLHYKENHGKGYALKYAFRYCIDNFSKDDLVVTADCDGQHKLEDVIKVYEASKDHKDALVLGSRDFRGNNVPKRSKSGNQQIRNMFKFFMG